MVTCWSLMAVGWGDDQPCGAGDSIKRGVKRSGTPDGNQQTVIAREGGRQNVGPGGGSPGSRKKNNRWSLEEGDRKMHLHNPIADAKKLSVARYGAGGLFATKPRAYARDYTLSPASAGSLSGFLKLALLLLVVTSSSTSNAQPALSSAPAG